MKTMITTIKSLPLLALLILASCNDYLDTKPSKGNNEILSTSEQVEALFNNSSMFIQSVSIPAASSDDMGMDNNIYDMLSGRVLTTRSSPPTLSSMKSTRWRMPQRRRRRTSWRRRISFVRWLCGVWHRPTASLTALRHSLCPACH